MESAFKTGDRVTVFGDISSLKRLQEGHGGWCSILELYLGKVGVVTMNIMGDVIVKYEQSSNQMLRFHPDAIKMIDQFSVGDAVKILNDIEKVKIYQKHHGGWNPVMASLLGKIGTVRQVYPDGDLVVTVSRKTFLFNHLCCKKVPQSMRVDEEVDNESLSNMLQKLLLNGIGTTVLDGFVKDAAKGNIQEVREFIKNQPSEINKKCSGVTALQAASGEGQEKVVLMLLEAGANLEIEDERKATALHYSASGDEPEIMELLLSKGANINAVIDSHHSVLHAAVSKESVECVRVLLKHSATVNTQDDYGDSPLHDAIRKENDAIVDMLISDSSIDFTIRNKPGFNVLHHAALYGNNFATERILKKKRDMVDVQMNEGLTALHIAAANGYRNVANTLLTVGQAQLDIRCRNQQTPLLLAVKEFHVGSIELLISKGAEVNVEDVNGDTCLQLVISERKRRINKDSEILESICTELNLDRDEPHWFIIACYLINRGANLYHKNHQGIMPLDILDDQSLREKLMKLASKSTSEKPKEKHTAKPQFVTKECLLCSDKQATILFQPCSHVLICVDCSNKITFKKCMECKEPITNKVAIQDVYAERSVELITKFICKICLNRSCSVAFECGHTVCKECGENLKECHSCHKPIQKKFNLY